MLAYVLMYTRGLCQHSFATGTEAVGLNKMKRFTGCG